MGWFDSPDGTKFFEFVIFKIEYFGLACTKAGGTPLQGDRGGFDSLRVHKQIQFSRIFTNWFINPTQRVSTRVGRSTQYIIQLES